MTALRAENPLIVQSDRSIVVEIDHPRYEEVRDRLGRFAELEKSPEYLHTYRVSPVSIWNAAALGVRAEEIVGFLRDNARYPIPESVAAEIEKWHARYGALSLERHAPAAGAGGNGRLCLRPRDAAAGAEVRALAGLDAFLAGEANGSLLVDDAHRGTIKQFLIDRGWPVDDVAGYLDGAPLAIALRPALEVRAYQREAADAFHAGGSARGGSGVVVLPCGSGKTIVGLAVMARLRTDTLVLTTNTAAVHQWKAEILSKTSLEPSEVGEYTGEVKDLRPVTVTTYQMLTYRKHRDAPFHHFAIFGQRDWGLVVYDEVHLLPAPVFSVTASLQARRRLGLTATLVREDGQESRVFSLIGPKRHALPWKVLERQGFIATALCREVRVPLDEDTARTYAAAAPREKFRIASESESKLATVAALVARHRGDHVLVLGQYLDQLRTLAERLHAPLITGKTPNAERESLYAKFRSGRIPVLVVSKVGNFAIDLPDANVAIQVSGTFGSRQEEAQRLGRILRPKTDGRPALFYAVVSADTREREFAEKRQRFLTEQGYAYEITTAERMRGDTETLTHRSA
ncbi:MAG TPA: DNA repair helicase XPB [Planctomycetota bacterium]|nr:DNA repair helicase XPB [Planctomycetota bacterium]